MGDMHEIIEAPLSGEELASRYRAMCEDPVYEKVPGKVELDRWGRILMTPAAYYHGVLQGRLVRLLQLALGGEASVEAPVVTSAGLFVADVAWASAEFASRHGGDDPLTQAPEPARRKSGSSIRNRSAASSMTRTARCRARATRWTSPASFRREEGRSPSPRRRR